MYIYSYGCIKIFLPAVDIDPQFNDVDASSLLNEGCGKFSFNKKYVEQYKE